MKSLKLWLQDVSDPAVMVAFPLVGDVDGASLVAWTTTPWTLPSNLVLCVNANLTYTKVSFLSMLKEWSFNFFNFLFFCFLFTCYVHNQWIKATQGHKYQLCGFIDATSIVCKQLISEFGPHCDWKTSSYTLLNHRFGIEPQVLSTL